MHQCIFVNRKYASITRKGPTKETIESSVEEVVDIPRCEVSILKDMACFINKSISISWPAIFKEYIRKEILENEEDRNVYINIKISRFYKFGAHTPMFPSVETIEWILQ